jgi:hypothetical protein
MGGGIGTGCQRRVPDDRFGVRVAMVRIFVDRAVIEQVSESAFAELVHVTTN